MSKKRKRKKDSMKIAELVIKSIVAIAALITAIAKIIETLG